MSFAVSDALSRGKCHHSQQPAESEGDKSNKRRPKILPSSFSKEEAHWMFEQRTTLHIPAKYGSSQGKVLH